MKHLLVLAFGLLSAIAHAEETIINVPVTCGTLKEVIEAVSVAPYREQPKWNGIDSEGKYFLTVNEKTGTWTFIRYGNQIACVLGTGDRSNFIKLKNG